jgi:tetratricopeptide (TPR) repeat protein
MAQAVRLNRTPELVEKGKIYLKEADTLIKKERYAEAMKAVRMAQECDPLNPYIDALEYRVKGLLEKQQAAATAADPLSDLLLQARSFSAEGRMDEAWTCAARATLASPHHTDVASLRSDLYSTELHARMNPPDDEIALCLTAAERCMEEGNVAGAMENAMQAFLLDPMHEALAAFESRHASVMDSIAGGLGLTAEPSAA